LQTFCSDAQIADSACSATAYLCGTKANDGTIGVTPAVKRYSCKDQNKQEEHVDSILVWAKVTNYLINREIALTIYLLLYLIIIFALRGCQ